MPRECRIGTFESDSAPPAIATSAWPSTIWSAASVIAWFAEAHARLTLHAWRFFGKSGISATSRAMFGARTFGTTVPKTSRSTLPGSTPGPVHELAHRQLAEVDGAEMPELRAGLGEGRADAGDDGDAAAGRRSPWT